MNQDQIHGVSLLQIVGAIDGDKIYNGCALVYMIVMQISHVLCMNSLFPLGTISKYAEQYYSL